MFVLNYQQFIEIWGYLFAIFRTIYAINTPDSNIKINSHWKCYQNFTGSKIYGENRELIGSETCYFILPCNQNGTPINPPSIILREWIDIRQYLNHTLH